MNQTRFVESADNPHIACDVQAAARLKIINYEKKLRLRAKIRGIFGRSH